MKKFLQPDQVWVHGVENGREYCLERPDGMKLHFDEEVGFALEAFLPAVTADADRLIGSMWDFACKRPVRIDDPATRALVHLLKRLCDLRRSDEEFDMTARASDTHEIVELRRKVENLQAEIDSLKSGIATLADCVRDGIDEAYGAYNVRQSFETWRGIALEMLKLCAPEVYREVVLDIREEARGSEELRVKSEESGKEAAECR